MRKRLLGVLVAAMLAAACDQAEAAPAGGGVQTRSALYRPPRVTLFDNARQASAGPGGAHVEPTLRSIPLSELRDATADLPTLLPFADYPFSGCHDRAHATWLALRDAVGPDALAKVWVFGPRLLTVALDGSISINVDAARWGVDQTTWDYHVAVVVSTDIGLRVIDPRGGEGFADHSVEDWLDGMTIDRGSVWTVLEGRDYSFNTAGDSEWSGGRHPLNGGMFEYDGTARAQGWMLDNLARDDVASALADDPSTCAPLADALSDATFLVGALLQQSQPHQCAQAYALFHTRRAAWQQRLAGWIDRPG